MGPIVAWIWMVLHCWPMVVSSFRLSPRTTSVGPKYWPSLTWSFSFYDRGNITVMQGYFCDDSKKPPKPSAVRDGGFTIPISNLFEYSVFPFWNNQKQTLEGSGCAYSTKRAKSYCFGGRNGSLDTPNWSSSYLYEYTPEKKHWRRYPLSLLHFVNDQQVGIYRPQTIVQDGYLVSFGGYVPARTTNSKGQQGWKVEHRPSDGKLHVLNVDDRNEFVLNPTSESFPKSRQGAVWVRWDQDTLLMLFGAHTKNADERDVYPDGYIAQLDINKRQVAWSSLVSKPEGLVVPPALAFCSYVKDPDSDTLYVFGGFTSSSKFTNELWRLTKNQDQAWVWTLVHSGQTRPDEDSDHVPSRRANANMVKVGRHLVVFGGYFSMDPQLIRMSDPISNPRVFFFDTCDSKWVQPLSRLDASSSCPFTPSVAGTTNPEKTESEGMSMGTILMIAILSSVLLALIVGGVIVYRRRKARKIQGGPYDRQSMYKSGLGNPAGAEGRFFVVEDFLPTMVDEVSLRIGDEVMISHVYSDGWATGINTATKNIGVFPVICIRPLPPLNNTNEKPLKETPTTLPNLESAAPILEGLKHAKTMVSTQRYGEAPRRNATSIGIPQYHSDMKMTSVPMEPLERAMTTGPTWNEDPHFIQPSAPPSASILATSLKSSVFSSDIFASPYDPELEQAYPLPKKPLVPSDVPIVVQEDPNAATGTTWNTHPSSTSQVSGPNESETGPETITIQCAAHDYPQLQRPTSIQSSCGDIVNPNGNLSRSSTEVLRKTSQKSRPLHRPRTISESSEQQVNRVPTDPIRPLLDVVQEEPCSPEYDLSLHQGQAMDDLIQSELSRANTVKMAPQEYTPLSPTALAIPDPFSQIVIPASPEALSSRTSHADVVILQDDIQQPARTVSLNRMEFNNPEVTIPVRSNSLVIQSSVIQYPQESTPRHSTSSSASTESIRPSSSCSNYEADKRIIEQHSAVVHNRLSLFDNK